QPTETGMVHVPSALVGWCLAGAALHDGTPIRHLVIQIEADAAEHVGGDLGDRLDLLHVGHAEEHHALALVTSRREIALDAVEIARPGQYLHADLGREG